MPINKFIKFVFLFVLLILCAAIADLILHWLDIVWVDRYLGIIGTLFIISGLYYSLRKKKLFKAGSPKKLLAVHEFVGWFGSLLILVHGGVHFNAVLPWVAVGAMIINVFSGIMGKYLLANSKISLAMKEKELANSGKSQDELEKILFFQYLAVDMMKKWRTIHLPISLTFGILALIHIVSILIYWDWHL